MRVGIYLLAVGVFFAPKFVGAETGIVSAVGSGRDSGEAIVSLLRNVVAKYFKDEPVNLSRALVQSEIVPNASSFVQSYKIIEGGRASSVALSANVDLDVIAALFKLTPAGLGEGAGAKALVVVRGAKLPEAAAASSKTTVKPVDPYAVVEAAGRDRFARRGFEVVVLNAEELRALGPGDDIASLELLRGLGARAGARLAVGVTSRYESFENENSHNKEQRIVMSSILVDVKSGTILGRSTVNVSEPKSRKEQYGLDLQRSLVEESKDLFHEAFVGAGKKLLKVPGEEDFSVVRVQYPSNSALVGKFRALLETVKGVRSVVEYSVTRGAFDFAVRPTMKEGVLAKAVAALVSEEILVMPVESTSDFPGRKPVLTVKVAPKEPSAVDAGREVQSEEP